MISIPGHICRSRNGKDFRSIKRDGARKREIEVQIMLLRNIPSSRREWDPGECTNLFHREIPQFASEMIHCLIHILHTRDMFSCHGSSTLQSPIPSLLHAARVFIFMRLIRPSLDSKASDIAELSVGQQGLALRTVGDHSFLSGI